MKNQKQKIYKVKGMSCPSCAMLIESDLDDAGINARVSYAKETLNLSDEKDLVEAKKIIQKNGYDLEID